MSDSKNVLFVCTGNTCRSPMAEALFKHAIQGRTDYTVRSAGVSASKGCGCNPETAEVVRKRGAVLEGFDSRPISEEELAAATHVFAMTRNHLQLLETHFPQYAEKFYLVCEFADIPNQGIGVDVPDPIGMGRRAYEEVADMFDIAIPTIIAYIDQTWKPTEG